MSRDDRVYLDDMLACAGKAIRYAAGLDFAGFVADGKTYDAVLRNLEILGEAASRVSDEVRARYSEVPWRSIIGLRNVLAHGYAALRNDVLWDVVQNKLPPVVAQLRTIIAAEDAR